MTRLSRPAGLLALLALAGCGDSSTGTLNGTVTLDGQPLKEGTVRFVPSDGKSQTASAAVKDGQFSAPVSVGEMKVEFSASKVTGKQKMYNTPDSPSVDVVTELIPERYNVRSELKTTVKPGVQSETYTLKSK